LGCLIVAAEDERLKQLLAHLSVPLGPSIPKPLKDGKYERFNVEILIEDRRDLPLGQVGHEREHNGEVARINFPARCSADDRAKSGVRSRVV
jgi:hypothetical protein